MAIINEEIVSNVSLQNFLLFLFVIILTFFIGGIVKVSIIKLLRNRTKPVVYKTASNVGMYLIYALGIYLAFGQILSFNLPAGLAALGVLGIALLLPLVPVLQNLVAGVVLYIERPFREEDVIEIDGNLCKVKDQMLRKTSLRALDGKIIIVPNIMFITSTPIINYSRGEFIKVALNIDVTPNSDKAKITEIIQKICNENINILPNVPEQKIDKITKLFEIPAHFFTIPRNIKKLSPVVLIKSVSKDKTTLAIWFWIWNITMKEKILSSFYEKLIEEFKNNNISFG